MCALARAGGFSVTCYNLGIRRDTSKDILRRWKTECSLRLPDACDDRVVLSCGVNDTTIETGSVRVPPEESRANVREILRGAGKYRVLMVGPPPVADDEQNKRIMFLSRSFVQEAGALCVPYVDLFSPLAADAAYQDEVRNNDGSHPRSGGYAKMARIVSSSSSWWFPAP